MRKVSEIVLDLAREVLRQPVEKTTEPAVAVALMLTHVAWNQSVEPGVIRLIVSSFTPRLSGESISLNLRHEQSRDP
jgi:hypothetical protein